MVVAVALSLLGIPAAAIASSHGAATPPPASASIFCSDKIDASIVPFFGQEALGRVAFPLVVPNPARDPQSGFQWFGKLGLQVKQGTEPVVISIPTDWRSRAAVGWNNRGGGPTSVEHVAGCAGNGWIGAPGGPSNHWLGYPGGYYVNTKGCMPLDVSVGHRQQRVYVDVGGNETCPRTKVMSTR
jgi:hypothetical protein